MDVWVCRGMWMCGCVGACGCFAAMRVFGGNAGVWCYVGVRRQCVCLVLCG